MIWTDHIGQIHLFISNHAGGHPTSALTDFFIDSQEEARKHGTSILSTKKTYINLVSGA